MNFELGKILFETLLTNFHFQKCGMKITSISCPVMAFQSQGSTLRGPVAVASGSALYKGLGNGPSSSSAHLYRYRPPGAASGQPGRQAANQTPLPGRPPPQTTSAPGLAQRTKRAHALRQASPPAS